MGSQLQTLSNATTGVSALSGLLLVSPQKVIGYLPNPPNPQESFQFNYEGEQSVSLRSDITDHYVEDNTATQDNIALAPEVISTHGFIGELTDIPANKALAALQAVANKLVSIGGYVPSLSVTALLAYNEAAYLYSIGAGAFQTFNSLRALATVNGSQNVVSSSGITKLPNQNKQQEAFQKFYGWWRTKTLFTVQTPWAVFTNMAITSLRPVQDAETRVISDFDVTFKMIRTVSAQTSTPAAGKQGQLANQTEAANPVNGGSSTGSPSSLGISDVSSILGGH